MPDTGRYIIENISGALKCQLPGGVRLGIPLGVSPRRFNTADTVLLKSAPGLVISSSREMTPWPVERFLEHNGQMVALGPWLEGSTPLTAGSLIPEDMGLLVTAARELVGNKKCSGRFSLTDFRRLAGGGFFVQPPCLTAWLQDIRPGEEGPEGRGYWNHPDLSGEPAWAFALGVLAWQILAKADPFAGETGADRRERMRLGTAAPVVSRIGDIIPEYAKIIDASLLSLPGGAVPPGEDPPGAARPGGAAHPEEAARPGDAPPSLEQWETLCAKWVSTGITGDCGPEEARNRLKSAQSAMEKKEKALKLRRWMRRDAWKYGLTAAGLVLITILAWSPVHKALSPPPTAGMSPMEVARSYYQAIDTLDSELMDYCLARKTGKADMRMVETTYVIHKVRQGYEGLGTLPRASEWLDKGQPELPDGTSPWGITHLKLSALPGNQVQAEYQLWYPGEGGAQSAFRQDILSFTETSRSWEISGIERTVQN